MDLCLNDELVEFLESGLSTLIATRDHALRPEVLRGFGTRVEPARNALTVFFPEALAQRTLANLADNGAISITYSRIVDHRSVQLKGTLNALRPATPEENTLQERYLASFVEQLYWVGMPRAVTRRLRFAPAIGATLSLREMFAQTPGPGAGRKLESA